MTRRDSALTTAHSLRERYGRLVSYSLPCPQVTSTDFLRAARGQPRFFWESATGGVSFAGAGVAVELIAWGQARFEQIQRQAAELFRDVALLNEGESPVVPHLFGGSAFRDDFVPDEAWSGFTPAHFVLPHYQLVLVDGEPWLSINVHIPLDENPAALKADLHEALTDRIAALQAATRSLWPAAHSRAVDVTYPMPYATWAANIEKVRASITRGRLNKAVLARVCEVRFSDQAPVDEALAYLGLHYAGCYRFLFEPEPHHAFFGATPELLASVQGHNVHTMALAGSIRRGRDAAEDAQLAGQLLRDPKERYEHAVVVERVRQRITSLTDAVQIGETDVLRLSNIQHLHTSITGQLREPAGVLPVVATLHPTPALGGEPRERALQLIDRCEPVTRGWYAAPVGWIDHNLDGAFAVAIRSAVVQEKRAWLYAGAGIVAESFPAKEWQETGLKFRPLLEALGAQELAHDQP
jgi:menaquinone-specific isochorismate synthase